MEPMRQCAALCYVEVEGAPLILLVTTRGRGRWTIPKGWPKHGKSEARTAAREAFEEGGVKGEVGETLIGTYEYTKRLHFFSWVRCRVSVYPLKVNRQFLNWREKESRTCLWAEPARAAGLVRERGLSALLKSFAPSTPAGN